MTATEKAHSLFYTCSRVDFDPMTPAKNRSKCCQLSHVIRASLLEDDERHEWSDRIAVAETKRTGVNHIDR